MRTRKILLTSEEVTKFTPVANYPVKLLEIKTPRGTSYIYPNPSKLVMKFYDSAAAQIPSKSELLFFKRRPGEDFGTFLGKVYYSAFYDLTEGQQRDTKNAAATTVAIGPVDMAGVQNDQDHLLEVWINSPVVVDTTQAASRFEITDVIEQN